MGDITHAEILQYLKTITDAKSLKPVHCVVYGSHVYETARPGSDWDIFCIVEPLTETETGTETETKSVTDSKSISLDIHNTDSKIDLTIRSVDLFLKDLRDGQPVAIEVLLVPKKFVLIQSQGFDQIKDSINLNCPEVRKSIRHGFSEKASWAEVRARKKLKDGEILCALKSLYHSYRILGFGIQIGTNGTITDWSFGKDYLQQLLGLDPLTLDDQSMRTSYKLWAKTGCSECGKDSIQTQFKNVLPK